MTVHLVFQIWPYIEVQQLCFASPVSNWHHKDITWTDYNACIKKSMAFKKWIFSERVSIVHNHGSHGNNCKKDDIQTFSTNIWYTHNMNLPNTLALRLTSKKCLQVKIITITSHSKTVKMDTFTFILWWQ